MKVTVVPAQVTTVEDRIAGSLGMSQLVLLAAPIFIGSGLYVILPPVMHTVVYKLVVIALLFVLCGLMAIRIKGKIVLLWLITLFRYNVRPRFYVYNKRDLHGREQYRDGLISELEGEPVVINRRVRKTLSLSTADVVELEHIIGNPAAKLSFETNKKGKLYVRITEIKQEG